MSTELSIAENVGRLIYLVVVVPIATGVILGFFATREHLGKRAMLRLLIAHLVERERTRLEFVHGGINYIFFETNRIKGIMFDHKGSKRFLLRSALYCLQPIRSIVRFWIWPFERLTNEAPISICPLSFLAKFMPNAAERHNLMDGAGELLDEADELFSRQTSKRLWLVFVSVSNYLESLARVLTLRPAKPKGRPATTSNQHLNHPIERPCCRDSE